MTASPPVRRSSARAVRFAVALTAALLAAACSESGGDAEPAGASPAASPQDGVVPASALARPVGPHDHENSAAMQIYWKRLRELALAAEQITTLRSRPLDDPEVAADVEKLMRRASADARGLDQEFARKALVVRSRPLGRRRRSRAELKSLRPTLNARYVRDLVVHSASPSAKRDGVRLAPPAEPPAGGEAFGFYSTVLPDMAAVEKAAAAGAVFWLVGSRETDVFLRQVAYPRDIPGREGRPLPIPVVFAPGAIDRHIRETVTNPSHSWAIDVVGPEDQPPQEAAVVSVTFRGLDHTRKIVVTSSRDPDSTAPGRGSTAAALGTMLEVMRVLTEILSNPPQPELPVDLELAHVLDGGSGYAFVPALREEGQTILGAVNIQDVLPQDGRKRHVFLRLDGTEGQSALERAMHSALDAYGGRAGAWKAAGVFRGGDPIPDGVARACGQERVPLVRLSAAGRPSADPPVASMAHPRPRRFCDRYDARHPYVGTAKDRVVEMSTRMMESQVLVGRALVIGLLRCAQAFHSR